MTHRTGISYGDMSQHVSQGEYAQMTRLASKVGAEIRQVERSQSLPLRVLYVVPGTWTGASMLFAHEEIARLALFVETRKFMLEAGVKPWIALRRTRQLFQLAREYHPDMIHVHFGSLTALICAAVSFLTHVPLVITFRGSDLNPSPFDGRVRNLAQKLCSQLAALQAEAIVCVSRKLQERLLWCRNKVAVIPSGVDLQLFCPVPLEKARESLGWRRDERIVLFNCGTRPDVKRLDLAEAAVEVARNLVGPIRFVVLRGNIGHEQLPAYLSGADCLLVTSDFEGSPDIVKEALACKLPIVSVDVGDVAERLQGVGPSRIVERDRYSIGAAIAEIVRLGLRSNGRQAIQELSADQITHRIMQVYLTIVVGEIL